LVRHLPKTRIAVAVAKHTILMETTERYLFLTCQDLLSIRFDRLNKACTKAFVFLTDADDAIPTALVKAVQGMGKNLRWISVGTNTDYLQAMYFELGRQHQKASPEIPFALIGKDPAYLSMYQFLATQNRPAKLIFGSTLEETELKPDEPTEVWLDVTLDQSADETTIDEKLEESEEDNETTTQTIESAWIEPETNLQNGYANSPESYESINGSSSTSVLEKGIFNEVATEVMLQMMHSGNRPSSRAFLRQYIHFQQHGRIDTQKIDDVIAAMVDHGDISLDGDEVSYAF
jgi:hypothetical protein